jgi:hypothetical protein
MHTLSANSTAEVLASGVRALVMNATDAQHDLTNAPPGTTAKPATMSVKGAMLLVTAGGSQLAMSSSGYGVIITSGPCLGFFPVQPDALKFCLQKISGGMQCSVMAGSVIS